MSKKKPLMRNIGEFFGHIVKAVKTNPSKQQDERQEVNRVEEETETEDMILRRTTIEEIEFKNRDDQNPQNQPPDPQPPDRQPPKDDKSESER